MDKRYNAEELKNFCERVFIEMGCPESDAKLASEVLISADLRGIDSHGIARLSGYLRLWKADRINAKPKFKIIRETPSTATLDADEGLGLVSGPKAMQIAINKANEYGTGWVAVQNSNHFGIAAFHSMLALEYNMIGIALTNASPLVSPTFSKDRLLGTNPICVAIPAGEEDPFVLDMATTTAANGKLEVLQRKDEDCPEGWVQDENGNITTDSHALKKGGSMLPLGGDRIHGSHKGYGLGAFVDIFSAVLSGANYGPWVPPFVSFLPLADNPVGKGIGHFFGAMRIDGFRSKSEFKEHMDNWIRTFKNSKTTEGHDRVIIPGEPEKEIQADREVNGVPVNPKVIDDLKSVAEDLEIDFI